MVTFPKLCFNDIGLPFGSGAVKSGATEPTSTAATGFKNLSNLVFIDFPCFVSFNDLSRAV